MFEIAHFFATLVAGIAPNKAVVHTLEVGLTRLMQTQIAGKQLPKVHGQAPNQRLANTAEPAHEERGPASRNPIGQQKVQLFMATELLDQRRWLQASIHLLLEIVKTIKYAKGL